MKIVQSIQKFGKIREHRLHRPPQKPDADSANLSRQDEKLQVQFSHSNSNAFTLRGGALQSLCFHCVATLPVHAIHITGEGVGGMEGEGIRSMEGEGGMEGESIRGMEGESIRGMEGEGAGSMESIGGMEGEGAGSMESIGGMEGEGVGGMKGEGVGGMKGEGAGGMEGESIRGMEGEGVGGMEGEGVGGMESIGGMEDEGVGGMESIAGTEYEGIAREHVYDGTSPWCLVMHSLLRYWSYTHLPSPAPANNWRTGGTGKLDQKIQESGQLAGESWGHGAKNFGKLITQEKSDHHSDRQNQNTKQIHANRKFVYPPAVYVLHISHGTGTSHIVQAHLTWYRHISHGTGTSHMVQAHLTWYRHISHGTGTSHMVQAHLTTQYWLCPLRRRGPDHQPPLQLPQHPHPPHPSGPLAGPGVHGNLSLQCPFTLNLRPSSYPTPTRASAAPLSLPG
ncbi:hypothetical protein FHG87_012892 [Trinorchestia longiramus]|nr:hypothetical protein FHG87_012892 [Trinorchestia longiramus]